MYGGGGGGGKLLCGQLIKEMEAIHPSIEIHSILLEISNGMFDILFDILRVKFLL